MQKADVIKETEKFVRAKLSGDSTGHDWWHIDRVRKTAVRIAKQEKADVFVVELGALLHDIADWKFHNEDMTVGPMVTRAWLSRLGVDSKTAGRVAEIVERISFKGAGVKSRMKSLEGKIVQDADKLDALGAIGIARTFAYGGFFKREIYNPAEKPVLHKTFAQYRKSRSSTIMHFYEKLLLLKDRMNTRTGRRMALRRHKFMLGYLDQFYRDWDGK